MGNPLGGTGVGDPLAGAADPLFGTSDPLQGTAPQAYTPTGYRTDRGKKTNGNNRTLVILGAVASGVVALGVIVGALIFVTGRGDKTAEPGIAGSPKTDGQGDAEG